MEFVQWESIGLPRAGGNALQVVFAPSRTLVRGVGVKGLPPGAGAELKLFTAYDAPTVVQLLWPVAQPLRELQLMLQLEEVPLVPIAVDLRRAQGPIASRISALRRAASVRGGPWTAQLQHIWDAALRRRLAEIHRERLLRGRRALQILSHPESGQGRGAAFFALLDSQTLFKRAKGPVDSDAIGYTIQMRPWLEQQVMARLNKGAASLPRPVDKAFSVLSALQARLFKQVWRELKDAATAEAAIDDIARGFNAFASGEYDLGCDNGYGEPDSAYFLFFAEFAFVAADTDLPEAPLWRALLPALVASQKTYLKAYEPPPGAPRVWQSWRFSNIVPKLRAAPDASALRCLWREEGADLYRRWKLAPPSLEECLAEATKSALEILRDEP